MHLGCWTCLAKQIGTADCPQQCLDVMEGYIWQSSLLASSTVSTTDIHFNARYVILC